MVTFTCRLINDPVLISPDLSPSPLYTVKSEGDSGEASPVTLLRAFRQCRALSGQPTPLTLSESAMQENRTKIGGLSADWEELGRPHKNAVDFFDTILPPTLSTGQQQEKMPAHLFLASVWHAIWNHANLNETPMLPL